MEAAACNLSAWEAEAGGSRGKQPGLHLDTLSEKQLETTTKVDISV